MSRASVDLDPTTFYDDPENLKNLCDFLRSNEGPPVREGIEREKRVHYMKGEKLVNFLVEPKQGTKWPKELPRFESRTEAIAVCKNLCKYQFIHRSEKVGKGDLQVSRVKGFDESCYFTWMYEGSKTTTYLMTTTLIVGIIVCTLFPLWPNFLKVFVWYMSVTFVLFIFFLFTTRSVLFTIFWILGYEFWFLPNLIDESLGFVDSFKPLISFEKAKSGQLPYRVGIAVGLFSFCYWAVTQPSDFEHKFLFPQEDFIRSIYNGTLLSDVSQQHKENIDKPKVEPLVDIINRLDAEEALLKEDQEEAQINSMMDKLLLDSEKGIDEPVQAQ